MRTFQAACLWGIGLLTFFLFSCSENKSREKQEDPLPSWNETQVKKDLLAYVKTAKEQIPEADRIAVFDMDGTIACETPLWFEMAVAVKAMNDQLKKDSTLISQPAYRYARLLSENPADTAVLNHWVVNGVNYLDSLILKAFAGRTNEEYIRFARTYLNTTMAPRYDRVYADLFYQPMLELLEYLKACDFKIYIVSGSLEGLVWSICPQTIDIGRSRLIGTRQEMQPEYPVSGETRFVLQKGLYPPKNNGDGKSVNIYTQIGKIPVFAFGNTTGDFGMFHLTATSKYPHLVLMLNHDDAAREYAYEPYHGTAMPAWQDTLKANGWIRVDMASEFKSVWMVPKGR